MGPIVVISLRQMDSRASDFSQAICRGGLRQQAREHADQQVWPNEAEQGDEPSSPALMPSRSFPLLLARNLS